MNVAATHAAALLDQGHRGAGSSLFSLIASDLRAKGRFELRGGEYPERIQGAPEGRQNATAVGIPARVVRQRAAPISAE
jgi:hypothetical protein